jgi:formate C-acetyltransferase
MGSALEQEPVYLFDDERLVGMTYQLNATQPEPGELAEQWQSYGPGVHAAGREAKAGIDLYFGHSAWPSHIGWRWDLILERGIEGLMHDIRGRLSVAADARSKRLYRGALILWRAALRWNDRHVRALRERADAETGSDGKQLRRLVSLCRRVPRKPARTFYEAVQSLHFQHLLVMYENPYGGNGPGRADYFLWPYLERDLAAGRITMGEAKELIDELLIRLHERIQLGDGSVESIIVGGAHQDGSRSANPISYMMIDSIGALDQTHPSVYVRLSQEDPEDFFDLSVSYLLHGGNRAQIYNDEACMAAITRAGVPKEDAAMFMAGGCMEISVQGAACDMNFTGEMNVAKTLELVLNGGSDLLSGKKRIPYDATLVDHADFESLYGAFETELAREYGEWVRALDIGSECLAKFRPTYLLSSLVDDCLERGRDQQDGGAKYHDYGFSPLGITAAADSLHAIKRAVYDEKFVGAGELLAAVRTNYEGREDLRLRLRNLPRYGAEDSEADAMADRVLRSVCELAAGSRNRMGGSLKPMIFSFVWIPEASRELGARADGQFAGERIGHGMTPQALGMTKGITAAMNSCTSIDYSPVSGGATTMWDLDPAWANFSIVKALLQRFFVGGGMIFQGNMTSVEELEDALRDPEQYPNLMVRVGGYSARFIALTAELQQEIVTRYRHAG